MDYNSLAENFVSKYDIQGKSIYGKIMWKNKHSLFHVQIFSDEQTWSGECLYEMLFKYRENVDENDEEYTNNVKDALKMNNSMYIYDFKVDGKSNVATFYWKKKFVDSTATLVHGMVSLEKDEIAGTKSDIINFLLEQNKNLYLTIEENKQNILRLNSDLENWKNEFEKFVDIKNSLETTLYGKFVQVLNSKKRRIVELEDHLNKI